MRKKERRYLGKSQEWWDSQGQHRWRLVHHYRRCQEGDVDAAFLDKLWEAQQGRCAYCEDPITLEECVLEHMLPICRGGTNSHANVCWACWQCNASKFIRTDEEFIEGRKAPRRIRKPRTKRKLPPGVHVVSDFWTEHHPWKVTLGDGWTRYYCSRAFASSVVRGKKKARKKAKRRAARAATIDKIGPRKAKKLGIANAGGNDGEIKRHTDIRTVGSDCGSTTQALVLGAAEDAAAHEAAGPGGRE